MPRCARLRHAGDPAAGGPYPSPSGAQVQVFIQAVTMVPKLVCASELPGDLGKYTNPTTEFNQARKSEIGPTPQLVIVQPVWHSLENPIWEVFFQWSVNDTIVWTKIQCSGSKWPSRVQ